MLAQLITLQEATLVKAVISLDKKTAMATGIALLGMYVGAPRGPLHRGVADIFIF